MGGKAGQRKDHQIGTQDSVKAPSLSSEDGPAAHSWWKDELSIEEFDDRLRHKIREDFILVLEGKKSPAEVYRDLDILAAASVPEKRTQPKVFPWQDFSEEQRSFLVAWGKVLLLMFKDHEHRLDLLASLTKAADDLHQSWSLMLRELDEKEDVLLEFRNGPIEILDEIKVRAKKLRFDDGLPVGIRQESSPSSGRTGRPKVPLVRVVLIGLGWMWQVDQPGILKLLSEIGYQEWDKSSGAMRPLTRKTIQPVVQKLGKGGWSALLRTERSEQ